MKTNTTEGVWKRKWYKEGWVFIIVLALLVLAGRHAAADAPNPNVNAKPSPDLRVNGDIYDHIPDGFTSGKDSARRAKIALGPNANATVSIDLIPNGGAGNQIDDGVTSGTVSGQGTKIAVEVFAKGVTTTLAGVKIVFDFKSEELKLDKVENSAFLFAIPEATGINFVATAPVTLRSSGFIGRAEFSTVADVTGKEFTLGIKAVTLAESAASSDVVTTTDVISFNANVASSPAASSSDFDGDGMVGTTDFLLFAYHYGSSLGDGTYQAKYDLDGNGVIGLSDVLIFVDNFGSQVPPSGGGTTVTIPDANLRAVIADSLGKASGAPITRAEMATLTRLDAPNKGIRNLTGLEHATNLQWVGLGGVWVNDELVNSNDISNLSPLSNLTNLTNLDLSRNSISDISVLSNLTNLTWLHLGENSISSISPLSNLTNLTVLYLWVNRISDISVLSNLTNLTWLALAINSISDISALSNLTNLTVLYLYNNRISDISVLSNLTNLERLSLWDNSISSISSLSNLTNLTWLYLSDNSVSDISPLVANTGLGAGDTVDLKSNPLSSTSINTHIPALQRRGVTVEFDISSGSGGSGGSSPDLIVESPSVSDNTLTIGQSFTLSATVRNQGTGSSAATTLRYYRSSNATISASDTEVGTDSVNGLSASGTSAESISLNAPSSAGTYYYGACVASVSGESNTGNNCSTGVRVTVSSSSGSPDLIVESPSVSDNTLTTGQSFTLSATVRNQGTGSSAETTLRYYRSSNATISTSDTEVGTDSVSGLSASGTSAESISLNAPSSAGTYYYGACVESVSDESDTNNNCSDAVSVTVSSSSGGSGSSGGSHGACRAGLVVNPNESCTYKDDYTFSVSSSGTGNIIGGGLFMSAGNSHNQRGIVNGVRWNFVASRNSGSNSWTIHTAE